MSSYIPPTIKCVLLSNMKHETLVLHAQLADYTEYEFNLFRGYLPCGVDEIKTLSIHRYYLEDAVYIFCNKESIYVDDQELKDLLKDNSIYRPVSTEDYCTTVGEYEDQDLSVVLEKFPGLRITRVKSTVMTHDCFHYEYNSILYIGDQVCGTITGEENKIALYVKSIWNNIWRTIYAIGLFIYNLNVALFVPPLEYKSDESDESDESYESEMDQDDQFSDTDSDDDSIDT